MCTFIVIWKYFWPESNLVFNSFAAAFVDFFFFNLKVNVFVGYKEEQSGLCVCNAAAVFMC